MLAAFSLLTLAACNKAEDPAKTSADVAAAEQKGEERVADAQLDAARQMGSADAEALRERADAAEQVTVAEAKANYDVAVEKCEALSNSGTGDARSACKKQAEADYDLVKARAAALHKSTDAVADKRD
ncbi:MAG: hypothetical protein ABIT36_13100 [Steroidobacteraceae bacterium]